MGGCCFSDGAIPGSSLLFWTVDMGFFRSGVIMGFWGAASLLNFVVGVALGYGSRVMGKLGFLSGAAAFGVWSWVSGYF